MAGIQETKEVLKVAAEIGNGVGIALQDGKFELSELALFVGALIDLPNAIQGIQQVPVELKDLDETERLELLNYMRDQFDIPQDETEEAVEDHVEFLLSLWKLVQKHYL